MRQYAKPLKRSGYRRWLTSSLSVTEGYSACFSKAAYESAEFAEYVIDKRRKEGCAEPLRKYRCTICSKWHLTKKAVAA
jgi:hypothetical protein